MSTLLGDRFRQAVGFCDEALFDEPGNVKACENLLPGSTDYIRKTLAADGSSGTLPQSRCAGRAV